MIRSIFLTLLLSIFYRADAQKTTRIWLDDLVIQSYSEGIRPVATRGNYTSDSMKMQGVYYSRGIGAQTVSVLSFHLNKNAKRFSATVGADDKANKDIAISFFVIADKKVLFESGRMRVGDMPKTIDVSIEGVTQLGLLVTDSVGGIGNKSTNCNWANAALIMDDGTKPEHIPNNDKQYILTPAPPESPRINSARVFGATPGNPFLYTIAATGRRPMQFSSTNLPEGLRVDATSGIISGQVKQRGIYSVTITAQNAVGKATAKLKIKIGDTIALTPPIGWNGWNSWANSIDLEKVIASADAMVKTGLRDHGWTYINIDDAWQGKRGGPLTALQPNEKFPEISKMVAYIHSLGLKAGLYSTPYISSYAGYVGASSDFERGGETHESIMVNRRSFNRIAKYRFETNDAKQMAEWGFDFLKYDWRVDVNSAERMSAALRSSGRDVVFSLSNSAPFVNVKDWIRTSNMYRTGPDIRDSWTSLYLTAFSLDKWGPYAGPGHWSDADMMIVGNVTTGPTLHPTRLTPDEQYSHVSLFSLLAAPLLVGCPLEQLDVFTLNLLTNDEVIAVNQDPLGRAGRFLYEEDGVQVWLKQLEDGSYAAGLFNTGDYGKTPHSYFRWGDEKKKAFVLNFGKAGLQGKWKIRDLWRQKDIGNFAASFQTLIPHHGVTMVRMFPL